MIRPFLIILYFIFCGLTNNAQSQVIKGQTIFVDEHSYDSVPGVSISLDSTHTINSDIDGQFLINTRQKYPNSVVFNFAGFPKLLIDNLPKNYDTLDLGKIEFIPPSSITVSQYDSIKISLYESLSPSNLTNHQKINLLRIGKPFDRYPITTQQKADSILKSKYLPTYCWSDILGYIVRNSISSNEIHNPYNLEKKVKISYNAKDDLIILDYSKLKE